MAAPWALISSFEVAQSMGFKGDFRQWEHLLLIGDSSRLALTIPISIAKIEEPARQCRPNWPRFMVNLNDFNSS